MSFISLTSDLGTKDGSVAKIKARLLGRDPNINLIDITHDINPFDLIQTAYIVKNTYKNFPENSVHILLVDALQHPVQKGICARMNNHFFLANNNGLISLIDSENGNHQMVKELQKQEISRFELFCNTALKLIENPQNYNELGPSIEGVQLRSMKPATKENQIIGSIIYVDNYGNAISNITHTLFDEVGKNRKFEIYARTYLFTQLAKNYADVVNNFESEQKYHGKNMALFNDNDYLEFAMYKSNHNSVGGASQLLGLRRGETIRIKFL